MEEKIRQNIIKVVLVFNEVNDLPLALKRCQILLYADDTVMYITGSDAQEIANTLTNELALVNQWLLDNSLFIHQGKTE